MDVTLNTKKPFAITLHTEQELPVARLYYMDNLRASAMLLGVLFHASLAYSPLMHNLWLTADAQQSILVDVVAWFFHLFRMPVFFLIAGFFTCFLLEKRGAKKMLGNRALRILLPFLIFLPLVLVATGATIGWAIQAVENPSPMLALITSFSKMPDAPAAPITTMHLWFLYQLVFFILLAVVIYKTVGFKWLQSSLNKAPLLFVAAFPLLLVPTLLSQPIPHPAPESFSPQLWSFGFYGLFFILGVGLFKSSGFLDRLQPYWPYLAGAGVSLYFVLFSMLPETVAIEAVMGNGTDPELTAIHTLEAVLEAYIAFFMTLAVLLISRKYFTQHSALFRYLADASYWIYLIHLPVLFIIQFQLLDVSWNMWLKLTVSVLGTIAIGMISYMVLVRWTLIGRLLNGTTKRFLFLILVTALMFLNTGCSISLTRNNYYFQPIHPKHQASKKYLKLKPSNETRSDETAN